MYVFDKALGGYVRRYTRGSCSIVCEHGTALHAQMERLMTDHPATITGPYPVWVKSMSMSRYDVAVETAELYFPKQ